MQAAAEWLAHNFSKTIHFVFTITPFKPFLSLTTYIKIMPLSDGTMELGSCITRIIHRDDTLTNVIITPTCRTACVDYDANESEDDNDSIDSIDAEENSINRNIYNLNMESSGSREWFCYLGFMIAQLTNLTQLTYDGLDPEDEELELFWGEISASTSLTSLYFTNMNLERGCEEMLSTACAPNLTSITFQGCTVPNEIGCFLQESLTLTTLCFIECRFSKTNTIREIIDFATELAHLTPITSFWFTSCVLDSVQSMCLVQCLQEERISNGDVQIHCTTLLGDRQTV